MRQFVEQLGLQAVVQPREIGPFKFGTSVRLVTGRPDPPGALSVTWIQSGDDAMRIDETSREILMRLSEESGFLGFVAADVDGRGYTLTAWKDEAAMTAGLRAAGHDTAMKRFFGFEIGTGGFTSVWQPVRLGKMWALCRGCRTRNVVEDGEAHCATCGARLSEQVSYV